MQHFLKHQKANSSRVDEMYNDLKINFDSLATHGKHITIQNARNVEAIKHEEGRLPRKGEVNPIAHCNVVSMKGVKKLNEAGVFFFDTDGSIDPKGNQVVLENGLINQLHRSTDPIHNTKTLSNDRSIPLLDRLIPSLV